MFDVGFWELAVIAVIALLIIGPERLPKAARTAGLWVGRARRMVADVKSDIDREIRESELGELKKAGEELNKTKSAFETAGSNLIKESELEVEKVSEELNQAKNELKSARSDQAKSSSTNSVAELIEDTTESVQSDKSDN